MARIGIDFGGTKIEAVALGENGEIHARLRTPTPATYDEALAALTKMVADLEQQTGARATVGVGAPGSILPQTGLMRNANTVYLNGRPFREDLSRTLGRPVRLANDANCLALSEAADGAAEGARVTFAIILGTGCGGGLVVDGRLVEGAGGVGGEWGHIPLPWPTAEEIDGPHCWCGQRGCLESWISGSGLQRDYRARTGRQATGEAIVAAADAGEGEAKAALDRLIDRLARAMAVICNILDPDVFVLGGGLSNLERLYQDLPDRLGPRVFGGRWPGRILKARWGDASGVRGAARLWPLPKEANHVAV